MVDISMCKDMFCPKKERCYRYTAKPSPFWQTYGCFTYNFGCDYFWDNNVQEITKDKGYEPTH